MDAETSTRVGPNTAALGELARIGLGGSLDNVLGHVAKLAREHVPGVDEASITLLRHDRATTAAFAGEAALELDERQYAAGYGPCLDALAGGALVVVPDTSRDQTYPDFSRRARELGFTHTFSVGMPMAAGASGALNLYGRGEGPFSDDALRAAQAFVDYAAIAVSNAALYASTAELAEQMHEAMQSRAVIEQAKGILIRDNRCTADEAFNMLVNASNRSNRKLRDIAQGLVESTQRGA